MNPHCGQFKKWKSNKMCEMLQKAYGESAMKKTSVFEWYKHFQDGRKHVERYSRPSTSIIVVKDR
jgi:hypothetical protein